MLPNEILDRVLDFLHNDNQTLAACALASRLLLQTSRYHRFEDREIGYNQAQTLIPLLTACTELACSITSLSYAYIPGKNAKLAGAALEEFAFLQDLTALTTLQTRLEALPYVAPYAPKLSCLRLWGLGRQSRRTLLRGISLFSCLEDLELIYLFMEADEEEAIVGDLRAPRLRKLRFQGGNCAATICQWLASQGIRPAFHSLHHVIRDQEGAVDFVALSDTLGHVAQELDVRFIPDGNLSHALEKTDFTLAPFSSIRSCALRFAFPEMCVPQNMSLFWIPTILAQLSSPYLQSLTLSLVVDNVEDLRSLNSECAVRVLTTAYFDDMRVLDWVDIEKALTDEPLSGVEVVILEGRGSRALLEKHIEAVCPKLHSRGILSLVAVKEHAAWSF